MSNLSVTDTQGRPRRLCKARRTNGEPCKGLAMQGQEVCRAHGGASPQARAKAQERIDAAADSAAARLIEWMNDRKVPHHVRLAAAKDLLDRARIGTDKKVQLELKRFEEDLQSGGLLIDVQSDPEPRGELT